MYHLVLVGIWVICVVLGEPEIAQAEEVQALAVPAEFVRYVQLPGLGDEIKRPGAIHFDTHQGEIFVADQGNNRILIFSRSGAYKFELGSVKEGRILQRFDFDGLPLEQLSLPLGDEDAPSNFRSLALDREGHVFLLDHNTGRVFSHGEEGFSSFLLHTSADAETDTLRTVFGDLRIFEDEILVPVSSMGKVVRHSLNGDYLGSIGQFGALPGMLNFPTCVQVTPEGLRLVLDSGRFCVVAYGPDGKFLGEFGGKGQSPGWFINPSLLAMLGDDQVVVGQLFLNRIQICRIPDFIREKVAVSPLILKDHGPLLANQFAGKTLRRLPDLFPSDLVKPARSRNEYRQNTNLISHLEVSE
jgi:hypothetical protein